MSKPFIAWQGGKRRLADIIIPMLPEHQCYVEPFAGGAAIYFIKEPSKVEVLNDINGELVNLYRVVKHHLEEFLKQFKWALASRQMFEWERMTHPETLTDVQRAARFYYIQKLCFGARPVKPTFGTATTSPPRLNLLRIEEDLSMAHLRLARTCIERLPWHECIDKYDRPDTFFYMDPPYYESAGYGIEFDLCNYGKMSELASTMKGKCIISINDHPEMRRAFKGLKMKKTSIRYTVGGAKASGKQSGELIYRNF